MKTLSLCMIVKNEEEVLSRCLESVKSFADEIIIVDTGSTDKTVKIAKRYTNNVKSFRWIDDFSAARNYSFSFATMEYCMWIDADDIIPQVTQEKLIEWKNTSSYEDFVMMPYQIAFDETGKPTFSYYRERLVKRSNGDLWTDAVHEVLIPHGNITYLNAPIEHHKNKTTDSDRNLNIYKKLEKEGHHFTPRQLFYYANELYYHELDNQAIKKYYTFLKGEGFFENKIQACLNLANIYLRQNKEEKALTALFQSFVYDLPRGEVSCAIGRIYYQKRQYEKAIYWYSKAIYTPNLSSGGFYQLDYYGFIPNLEIALCYYQLGDMDKAKEYNHKALDIKPNNSIALSNHTFYTQPNMFKNDK